MGVQVAIVLTGVKSTILFLDKEEGRCLGRFGWVDFPRAKIFINELIGSFPFFDQKRVELPYFLDKGFIEFNGMVVGSGQGYMICGFF